MGRVEEGGDVDAPRGSWPQGLGADVEDGVGRESSGGQDDAPGEDAPWTGERRAVPVSGGRGPEDPVGPSVAPADGGRVPPVAEGVGGPGPAAVARGVGLGAAGPDARRRRRPGPDRRTPRHARRLAGPSPPDGPPRPGVVRARVGPGARRGGRRRRGPQRGRPPPRHGPPVGVAGPPLRRDGRVPDGRGRRLA